jgi:hypothetical protein
MTQEQKLDAKEKDIQDKIARYLKAQKLPSGWKPSTYIARNHVSVDWYFEKQNYTCSVEYTRYGNATVHIKNAPKAELLHNDVLTPELICLQSFAKLLSTKFIKKMISFGDEYDALWQKLNAKTQKEKDRDYNTGHSHDTLCLCIPKVIKLR